MQIGTSTVSNSAGETAPVVIEAASTVEIASGGPGIGVKGKAGVTLKVTGRLMPAGDPAGAVICIVP
jgi:hypothetical protein